jgi:HEAT repeat protein
MAATKRKGLWDWCVPALIGAGPVLLVFCVWRVHHALWSPQNARLDDENPAVRAAAIRSLPPRGNEDLVIKMLEDEDADVRLVAVMALDWGNNADAGSVAKRARAFVRALGDELLHVRREAAWALSWLGSASWPALREALEDQNPRIRAGAALSFTYRHPKEESTLLWEEKRIDFYSLLERLTNDPDAEVCKYARKALGR